MSEKWEDGNYVLYPAINHEQSLTDELLKSRQSPEALNARIAELEAFVDQLIEVGQMIAECSEYESGRIEWEALVDNRKEREE